MRRVPLRPLRSIGRQGFFPSPEAATAASRESVLPGINPSSAARPLCDGASTAEFLRRSMLSGSSSVKNPFFRKFSSMHEGDETSLEEEAERKAGWLLKLIFIGSASLVASQFFPYMGDNLLQQSISLLHVKDPLFKRMGASRLARFAVDDERRMKVVEVGGAQELLNMLKAARDDKTRKHALKALVALSHCDEAAVALRQAGAIAIVSSTPNSMEYAEVESYKSSLLKRFQELKHDIPSEVEIS